ncbi:hypothetical protein Slin15195_G111730 [Septoria linicola]|uniref:Uncharacterized protein n=1 Tax=Septoria linicola TaxID=215465 RepID=A0A9Q9EPM8_9PEZI|nr:hypothetical protein Slin14017_G110090 [Septoria linicola]USW57854.1 hypothetical protein Slin15195_G111730 [Septoria linicola]
MAPRSTASNSDEPEHDLNGYIPLDVPELISTNTLSQAIASKAASIYPFYLNNATKTSSKPKTIRCDDCKRRKRKCEHNAPIAVGTLNEVKTAATEAFQFFIDHYHKNTFDIVGLAKEYLHKRKGVEKEHDLVVEMIMGIVGVIHVYQTSNVQRDPVEIPEMEYKYNSLPKGTESVMAVAVGYADEVREWVWVFDRLIAKLDGQGPDGSEGDWEDGEERMVED